MNSSAKKWTKQLCKKEALRFSSRTSWSRGHGHSYNVAAANGWIDECCSHMVSKYKPSGFWTKEACEREARKFTSRSQWAKLSGSSYNLALSKGWLPDCCGHMEQLIKPSGFWSKQACIAEAKQYSSSSEWQAKSGSSYGTARANKWLPDCTKHFLPKKMRNGYWTKPRCAQEAKLYKTRSEFERKARGAYHAALKNHWMDHICIHMKSDRHHEGYTKKEMLVEALKYETRKSFREANAKMVLWATRHGHIDEICAHMRVIGNKTKRQLYAFEHPDKTAYVGQAGDVYYRREQHLFHKRTDKTGIILREKYKIFGDRQVWRVFPEWYSEEEIGSKERELFEKYRNSGWSMINIESAIGALGGVTTKWTLNKCLNEAKKFQSRAQMDRESKSAYRAILAHNWQHECFGHMGPGKVIRYTDKTLLEAISKVKSLQELREQYPLEYRAASKRKKFRIWTHHLQRERKLHTDATILAAAQQCNTRHEFFKRFGNEYRAAKRRGIFEKAVAHMSVRNRSATKFKLK